jgi:choline dehydrogenase
MNQYMEATERNIPPNEVQVNQGAANDPEVHGHNGFINTSFPVCSFAWATQTKVGAYTVQTPMRIPKAVGLYKQALRLVFPGLGPSGDMSNRTSVSMATTLYTIWRDPVTGKNRRSSAADGLLWAADQQRPTLTVLATHKVDRVLFDKKLTATGVAFLPTIATSRSNEFKVFARKGVILSAGSLATPPILERSGIGRPDVLKAVGIHKLVDLPGVGANLNAGNPF